MSKIPPQAWQAAREYFEKYPARTQLKQGNYSFVWIYTLCGKKAIIATLQKLGVGAKGMVKAAEVDPKLSYREHNWVVKIQAGKTQPKPIEVLHHQDHQLIYQWDKNLGCTPHELHFMQQNEIMLGYQYLKGTKDKTLVVMKRYSGINFEEFLQENFSKLTENQKYLIALRLAQAVKSLHDRDILHHDLKPENFMIDVVAGEEGTLDYLVNIIDFGYALKLPKDTHFAKKLIIKNGITITGNPGTNGYASPEIREGFTSKASDVFALGCILTGLVLDFDNVKYEWNNAPGLFLPDEGFLAQMLELAPEARPSIDDVVTCLISTINDLQE